MTDPTQQGLLQGRGGKGLKGGFKNLIWLLRCQTHPVSSSLAGFPLFLSQSAADRTGSVIASDPPESCTAWGSLTDSAPSSHPPSVLQDAERGIIQFSGF